MHIMPTNGIHSYVGGEQAGTAGTTENSVNGVWEAMEQKVHFSQNGLACFIFRFLKRPLVGPF